MTGMHLPERTCIGCKKVFHKEDVVRIVVVSGSVVIDYREKLGGRAAYVCPRQECIGKALVKEHLVRSMRMKITLPTATDFTAKLISAILDRVRSLLLMAAKAGKLVAGFSAVRDHIEKHNVEIIVFSKDVSGGTKERIADAASTIRPITLFTKEELGRMLGRGEVGVIAIKDRGFANSLRKEAERLKGLLNIGQ